jgi:hypothetical protein
MGTRRVKAQELLATDRIDGVEVAPVLKEPTADGRGQVTIRLGLPGERTVPSDTDISITDGQ